MRIFLLLATMSIYFFTPLQGEELSLRTQLEKAHEKSWIVIEQNKNYVFFYIHKIDAKKIFIEEVTIPASCLPCYSNFTWRGWFENGAPGHTLWTLSQIDLTTGHFENSYSYTHQSWLNLSQSMPFMTTLLNLSFTPVPERDRRRIGLPPSQRKADTRRFWQPRLIVEGERINNVHFSVWQARWPSDGSELSRKRIEIYLPEEMEGRYPTYFPYWLEVEGKLGSAKVRIVDSGMEAFSPIDIFQK